MHLEERLQLFSPANSIQGLTGFVHANLSTLLSSIALFLVFATLLGFILDGIHHFIFLEREETTYGIYRYITSLERLQIARCLLDDDYWYPYEAFANLWLSMMPGLILLPHWMITLSYGTAFIAIIMVIYVIVFEIMRRVSKNTLETYKNIEAELMKAFSDTPSAGSSGTGFTTGSENRQGRVHCRK